MDKLNIGVNETNLPEQPGKSETANMKERLTSLFSLGGKKDADGDVPPPGTPPTFNDDGSVADEGNPFIGPIDPKLGYATQGYSGSELRRIKRAQARRQAAERRVGQRAYDRQRKAQARLDSMVRQRQRIVDGVVQVTPAMFANMVADSERLLAADGVDEQAKRTVKAQRREDRLADRRWARFRAGQPRGKDLREDIYNEYESLLPTSARRR
jgi:hypothetical protein